MREARRFLKPDSAQDAAQEALLRAWHSAHACQGPDPGPWVRTIARREALRIAGRHAEEPLAQGQEPTCEPGPFAAQRLDLVRGISRLSVDEQRALLLRYWAGKSDRQISVALRAPVGTVKVRIHRAQRKLARELVCVPEDAA